MTDGTLDERLAAAADYIRLRDYSPMQILERRLAAARAEADPIAARDGPGPT